MTTPTRREFLCTSMTAGAAAAFAGMSPLALGRGRPAAKAPLKILILGGTAFVGPATVEAALARGHTLTLFNRGRREKLTGGPDPRVEHVYGNRDPDKNATEDPNDAESPKGLESLKGGSWDVVIDNSGFYPRMVKASAEMLAPVAKHYIFISSISAYKDNSKPEGQDETAELATMPDPTVESMGAQFENYGPLKVLCEKAAAAAFRGRATIVRPGYIVGPNDGTDRFTYWPVRISKGGEVLCPGTPNDPIQIIDVRDLGEWLVHLAETRATGDFNACGPLSALTMGEVVQTCKKASGSDATFTWADPAFLGAQRIQFPIWVRPDGETAGFHRWSNARAVAAGLKFRPLETIVRDLLAWYPKEIERRIRVTKQMMEDAEKAGKEPPRMPDPERLRAGPTPDAESKALLALKEQSRKDG